MKKFKVCLGIVSLFAMMPIVYALDQGDLHATQNDDFSIPDFQIGDDIHFGNQTLDVVKVDDSLTLLSQDLQMENVTHQTAIEYFQDEASQQAVYGSNGYAMIQPSLHLASESDLIEALQDGTYLPSSISQVSNSWWLADQDTENNRSKYMSADNKNNSINTITEAIVNESSTCDTRERDEVGILPTTDEVDEEVFIESIVYTGGWASWLEVPGQDVNAKPGLMEFHADNTCSDAAIDIGYKYEFNCPAAGYVYRDGKSTLLTNEGTPDARRRAVFYLAINLSLGLDMTRLWSSSEPIVVKEGQCFNIEPYVNYEEVDKYDSSILNVNEKTIKSIKVIRQNGKPVKEIWNFAVAGNLHKVEDAGKAACPIQSRSAGLASVRSRFSLNTSAIALGNQNKRTFAITDTLRQPAPRSDGTAYLTLYNDDLQIGLTQESTGVQGQNLTATLNADGTIDLPITVSGNAEGTRYVSAVATKPNGDKVYGVLGEMDADTGVVKVNTEGLTDSSTSTLSLTLYQEDTGLFDTAYIGRGQDITIQVLGKQEIAFKEPQPTEIIYGDTISIEAFLQSDISSQSSSDLTFSILEGTDLVELTQSCTPTTGIANAQIQAKKGAGTIRLAIDKAGDLSIQAADQKVITLTLAKKEIVVKAKQPDTVYAIGDSMPLMASTCDGLVSEDILPAILVPELIPYTEETPPKPDENGVITESGKWKLQFNDQIIDTLDATFLDNYDIIFYDYRQDSNLIFEVSRSTIPDAWIEVLPAPNEKGWNKENVTIQPSQVAKDEGYTIIEQLEGDTVIESGQTLLFDTNTDGTIPLIRLKKGALASNTKLIREIKIDKTLPQIEVSIENQQEWTKQEKKVTIQVQDDGSGIDSVIVKKGSSTISVQTVQAQKEYEFNAQEEGTYTLQAVDQAGNKTAKTIEITKLDKKGPTISDISDNITDTVDRGPQTITFQAQDFNDDANSELGSGIATGYPNVYLVKNGQKEYIKVDKNNDTSYQFLAESNSVYVIEIMDKVGFITTQQVQVDHIMDMNLKRELQVVVENNDEPLESNTWAKGMISFHISGGWDESCLKGYQVAISEHIPEEGDWKEINNPDVNQHILADTENIEHANYWFRALPVTDEIYGPFIVQLDNTKPHQPSIHMEATHQSQLSRFINAISFGSWLKEGQNVTYTSSDNFTATQDLTYLYAEEKNGVRSDWNPAPSSLFYEKGNLVLHVKTVDLAGNESEVMTEGIMIDTIPPEIIGVEDQSAYKYYYLPRYVQIKDDQSGVKKAEYTHNQGAMIGFDRKVSFQDVGEYKIYAEDMAGNSVIIEFKIIALPSLDDIDGSDESKAIIDQVKNELSEIRNEIDENQKENYEKWIHDAMDKWEKSRKNVIDDKETSSKVEGVEDTTFDPNIELIVNDITDKKIPSLPRNAIKVYDVFLKKGNTVVQPDGNIKVYLPYKEKEAPIVYEIDDNGNVKEIKVTVEGEYLVFITDKLHTYAISNLSQKEEKPNEPTCPNDGVDINIDTDNDGMPDMNIDIDKDCEAELNLDLNGDNIPDTNIDTDVDGEPDYNIDADKDGKADLNIGPNPDPWRPTLCNKTYCTDPNLKPELNIDTDHDGKPDINIDTDGDGKADINIDINHDGNPDLNIDTNGDGKADKNIDANGNGIIDSEEQVIKPAIQKETSVENKTGVGGALTGHKDWFQTYRIFMLLAVCSLCGLLYIRKKTLTE